MKNPVRSRERDVYLKFFLQYFEMPLSRKIERLDLRFNVLIREDAKV